MHLFFKLFDVTLIPYLNHGGGFIVASRLLPSPGSWDKLWEVLHVIFFLDLSHGFAWELNWETYRPEDTWWRASISEIIFE